jgi:hypothetical protein
MLRRVSVCLAVSLSMFASGCKKESGEVEGDAASKAGEGDKQPEVAQPTPTPTPSPTPVAPTDSGGAAAGDSGVGGSGGGVGGSGGGAAKPRGEDLTCDPLDRGACLEGEQCLGGQGCDAVWSCDAEVVCKKGVKEYCGCDGRTFEAVYGNCPWKKYQYEGPCK